MPSIYANRQCVAYQNLVRVPEIMPSTIAFHHHVNPTKQFTVKSTQGSLYAHLRQHYVHGAFKTTSISQVNPSEDEPSLCIMDFNSVHVHRINSLLSQKQTNSHNKHLMNGRNGVISVIMKFGYNTCCQEVGKCCQDYVSCFSLHFFRAVAASCVPYNRTEHSQGFSIC